MYYIRTMNADNLIKLSKTMYDRISDQVIKLIGIKTARIIWYPTTSTITYYHYLQSSFQNYGL